jgi:adenylyltransferase/sulfurtransferase
MELSRAQIERYSRHILLPDIGGSGQKRLLGASVAVSVGPRREAAVAALVYLAAAGVGRLLLSGDPEGAVGEREARLGIAYGRDDVGARRIDALRRRLTALNPEVTVEPAPVRLPLGTITTPELDRCATAQDVNSALESGAEAALQILLAIARQP